MTSDSSLLTLGGYRAAEIAYRLGLWPLMQATGLFSLLYRAYKRFDLGPLRRLAKDYPALFDGHAVDVGAHWGLATKVFATAVPEGSKVVALEPERDNFVRLARRVSKLRNVLALPLAVGREEGAFDLALHPFHCAGHTRFSERLDWSPREVRAVPSDCLDAILERNGIALPRVSFVKLDTEGSEAEILRGMRRLLSQPRVSLWVENRATNLLHQGEAPNIVEDLLRSSGFRYAYELRRGRWGPAGPRASDVLWRKEPL